MTRRVLWSKTTKISDKPSYDKPKNAYSKSITMILVNTKPKIKSMNVEQVHLKDSCHFSEFCDETQT